MKNRISEDLEFEKNRMEILKKINPSVLENRKDTYHTGSVSNENSSKGKRAWEYELEEYRSRKSKEKFFIFGASCGIVSLILNIIFNYYIIVEFFKNIF